MTTFKRYAINNEQSFMDLLKDEEGDWPEDQEIEAAGFNPADEELQVSVLMQDWQGHKAGARVLHTLALRDYPFAVESSQG